MKLSRISSSTPILGFSIRTLINYLICWKSWLHRNQIPWYTGSHFHRLYKVIMSPFKIVLFSCSQAHGIATSYGPTVIMIYPVYNIKNQFIRGLANDVLQADMLAKVAEDSGAEHNPRQSIQQSHVRKNVAFSWYQFCIK